jgi:hypothetical protein
MGERENLREELAIIKNVEIANDECGSPGLSFECCTEGRASSQFIDWEKAGELVGEFGSFKALEGAPCIASRS